MTYSLLHQKSVLADFAKSTVIAKHEAVSTPLRHCEARSNLTAAPSLRHEAISFLILNAKNAKQQRRQETERR
jgi:hypothetical protein